MVCNQLYLDMVNEAVERPVFLIGAERSGTTLLRLMLNHHPLLAFHFESAFVVQPFINGQGEPVGAQLRGYQDWLRSSSGFKASGFVIDESLSYRDLVRSFLRQKVVFAGKPNVGMTIHKGFEFLPNLWPKARYIHLIRDGRDVANSAVKMGWYGNAWAASERWKRAMVSYHRLLELSPPENVIEVRFEQLVSDSKAELKRISKFIGIPYDQAFFDYENTSSYSLPGRKKAANWRDHLDKRMIRGVEAEIGNLLQQYGYDLSGQDQIVITDELRDQLLRENNYMRRKWRIRRFGFWTIILDKVANKMKLRTLQALMQARMLKISRANLK